VQVSEEQLAFTHARILGRDRLFHFHDHSALAQTSSAEFTMVRRLARRVNFKARTLTGAGLNPDVVTRHL
jgi:hypothetical protein